MRPLAFLLLAGLLAGCQPLGKPGPDPSGRFQNMGKREYSNGTELYFLDTKKGQICYVLVTNDTTPDREVCAGIGVEPFPAD